MGPVFSSFAYEEDSNNELMMEAIHASAREGEMDTLLKYVDSGVLVNLKDGEGRSPLHWAVDRGHLNIVELLLSKNADVNAQILQTEINIFRSIRDGSSLMQHMEDFYYITLLENVRSNFKTSSSNSSKKLFIEEICRDIYRSDNEWRIILLRYFIPVGAHPNAGGAIVMDTDATSELQKRRVAPTVDNYKFIWYKFPL